MSEKNHSALRKLIGFKLENHPLDPVSQDRLDALNRYLEKRTVELLKVPVVDEQELATILDDSFKQVEKPIAMLACQKEIGISDLMSLADDDREPEHIVRDDGFGRE